MGNLSFAHNAGFSWYCILLMLSGIAMLVTAVLRNQAMQRRVIRAIFGIGFFCYGFYLTFIFSGGHYVLFFQAFIVPVLLILDTIRGRASRRRMRQTVGAGGPGVGGTDGFGGTGGFGSGNVGGGGPTA
jgi:hypothetical protein